MNPMNPLVSVSRKLRAAESLEDKRAAMAELTDDETRVLLEVFGRGVKFWQELFPLFRPKPGDD